MIPAGKHVVCSSFTMCSTFLLYCTLSHHILRTSQICSSSLVAVKQQVGQLGSKQFQSLNALHAWQVSYANANYGNACLAQAVRPSNSMSSNISRPLCQSLPQVWQALIKDVNVHTSGLSLVSWRASKICTVLSQSPDFPAGHNDCHQALISRKPDSKSCLLSLPRQRQSKTWQSQRLSSIPAALMAVLYATRSGLMPLLCMLSKICKASEQSLDLWLNMVIRRV